MPDLSVLIPCRNEAGQGEQFLARTVQDILDHAEGDTEVIVCLDGAWPAPPLEQHPKLTVVYFPEAIGQRAATNQAARLSEAKYVMKCDAHCSFDQGFDVKLMDGMQDDWTIVPAMLNLHAYDWLCGACEHRIYQGPTPNACPVCGGPMEKDVLWRAKPSPYTTAMRFDRELRFQYWGGFKGRQGNDMIVETMSILGACWMLTRERYWALNICDEEHGSWGQQGTEVACKTWLSGGRLVVSKRTWFAHMFRTQGGDFSFPYPQSGRQLEHARAYSRQLWLEDSWEGAKYPLSWLLERFAPIPDWHEVVEEPSPPEPLPPTNEKGIVYYTDNRLNIRIAKTVQNRIKGTGIPIVSASLKPMPHFPRNIQVPGKPGVLQMFKQILAGLEASEAKYVFFCEHDVLYHYTHFDFEPPRDDVFYYNTNVWKIRLEDGFAVRTDDCRQTSGLCANRYLLIEHYRERVRRVSKEGFTRKMGYEPGTHGRAERVDDYKSDRWESTFPNLDLRVGGTLTADRWSPEEFRNPRFTEGWQESTVTEIPGWDKLPSFLCVEAVAVS